MKLIFHLQDGKEEEFIVDKNSVTLGRGNTCDVVLPFEGFSRKHAQIELVNGEIWVTDLGSTNGVLIDGTKITPHERTQMQSFFTLSMGSASQVEVIDVEDNHPISIPVARVASSVSSPSPIKKINENTRTTGIDTSGLKRTKKATVENKSSNQTNLKMILMPLLIVGAAAYYFLVMEPESEVPTEAAEVAGPVVVPVSSEFVSPALLVSDSSKKSCEGILQKWCTEAAINPVLKEGVVIDGANLIVYMNMTSQMEDKYHPQFAGLSQIEKLEVLLLKRTFESTLLRSLSRQQQFSNVQVVGGIESSGEMQYKISVKINRDIDQAKFNKFILSDAFDQAVNAGVMDNFKGLASIYSTRFLD